MSRLIALFCIGLLISGLSGCGHKGPLYLPDQDDQEQEPAPGPDETEDD